ncbi:MAG: hypothetical protein DHS20C18_33780 [Saprospiraceae bacterium]|nr:MAG: hypothetical protein DHS20C18_33780 [Saprospiraceae bacterium]
MNRFICFCLLALVNYQLWSQNTPSLPDKFYDEKVGADWERPVGITFDTEGRGYVWEKKGKVYILTTEGEKISEPLIDISEEVVNWSDHGLLGFALDPDFINNGYFYLLYVVDRHYMDAYGTPEYDPNLTIDHEATIGRITRYTADPGTGFTTVIPESRKVILGTNRADGPAVLLGSHGVGSLVFGKDGTLLASIGDGGSYQSIDVGSASSEESFWEQAIEEGILRPEDNVGAFKSLQIDNMNGCILRIDPDTGAGISSNPFYNSADPFAARSRVWVLGFRNPYRFTLIPETGSENPDDGDPGTLFIGDVGGGGWEELNIATKGGQCFGWPVFEGINYHWGFVSTPTANPDAPNPLAEEPNCHDDYFTFQHLIEQPKEHTEIRFLNPCDHGLEIPEEFPAFVHTPPALTWSSLLWNPPPKTRIPAFDPETEALMEVDINSPEASVEGIEFPGFTSIPGFFYQGEKFPDTYRGGFFHADLSGWIRVFHFNESAQITQIDTFAHWDDKGIVHLTYNPHDEAIYWCHVYDSEVHKITYGGNPAPVAQAIADQAFGPSPLIVNFDASTSFDPDGGMITYHWDFGDGTSSTAVNPTHTFLAASQNPDSIAVVLTVTDSAGLASNAEVVISLNNTPPQVSISSFQDGDHYAPNGLTLLPLKATVEDAEQNDSELTYKWETFLQHNTHFHPEEPDYEHESQVIIDPLGCGDETFWYRIRLTVTDAAGLSSQDEHEIYPYCGDSFFTLLSLDWDIEDQKVLLDWSTSFEQQLDHFEVQRSADYRFSEIGTVSASGTSNVERQYGFTDVQPMIGTNYYRIKGVRNDGVYLYSNIIAVDFSLRENLLVYPNPTRDKLTLFLHKAIAPMVEFEVFNVIGQNIYNASWEAEIGLPFIHSLRLASLESGLYYYRMKNGERERVSSFLILE